MAPPNSSASAAAWRRCACGAPIPPAAERARLRAGQPVAERIATPESLLTILRTKAKALPLPANASAAAAAPEAAAPIASAKAKPGDDRLVVQETAAKPATATTGSHFIQVAAFSSEARAEAAAKSVGGVVSKAGNLWRVRMGPYAGSAEAQAAIGKARAKGFRDAVIVRDR